MVCCIHTKIQTKMSFHSEICPKGANRMANSVEPEGATTLSGSTMFAIACLSENLVT